MLCYTMLLYMLIVLYCTLYTVQCTVYIYIFSGNGSLYYIFIVYIFSIYIYIYAYETDASRVAAKEDTLTAYVCVISLANV